jgi:carbon monoxide dehydrogenase subunit G
MKSVKFTIQITEDVIWRMLCNPTQAIRTFSNHNDISTLTLIIEDQLKVPIGFIIDSKIYFE